MFHNHPLNKKNIYQSQTDGFTLIEVLVGIILTTVFVLIATQAIAISAVYRVQASRKAEALLAIQDDLENVKFAALQLPSLQANCSSGYANALISALPAVTNPTLVNKPYDMVRTPLEKPGSPHIMTLSYSIEDPDSRRVISELYTEVLPDAAFDCN